MAAFQGFVDAHAAHALAAAHGAPGPFSEAVQTACIEAAKRAVQQFAPRARAGDGGSAEAHGAVARACLLAALAAVYVVVNLVVVRRTTAGQRAVEQHHQDVFGRVGDVIGNVVVVQSYARLAAEARARDAEAEASSVRLEIERLPRSMSASVAPNSTPMGCPR